MFGRRKKYLLEEDMKIIHFILDNNWHSQIGGNVVWKNMEAAKVSFVNHRQRVKRNFYFTKNFLRMRQTYVSDRKVDVQMINLTIDIRFRARQTMLYTFTFPMKSTISTNTVFTSRYFCFYFYLFIYILFRLSIMMNIPVE